MNQDGREHTLVGRADYHTQVVRVSSLMLSLNPVIRAHDLDFVSRIVRSPSEYFPYQWWSTLIRSTLESAAMPLTKWAKASLSPQSPGPMRQVSSRACSS